jgi:hypothetical protein
MFLAVACAFIGEGELYGGVMPVEQPLQITVRKYLLRTMRLDVEVDASALASKYTLGKLEASLVDNDGKVLVESSGEFSDGARAKMQIDVSKLKAGSYRLRFVVVDADGRSLHESQQALVIPQKPQWLGNREGISDEVLPPWTPLKVRGKAISPWGREYVWGILPFPERVRAKGEELLSSPIRLVVNVDGRRQVWKGKGLRFTKKTPARVEFIVDTEGQDVEVSASLWCEYDGCVKCDWKIVPKQKGSRIEEVIFEIPFKAKHARLIYHYPGRWGSAFNAGSVPREGMKMAFRPYVWLGDEWRGLAWFCPSDENFRPKDPKSVTELVHNGDSVLLRVNLIQEPFELNEPIQFTFGFEATPIRPNPEDVWDYRIVHTGNYGLEKQSWSPPRKIRRETEGNIEERLTVLDMYRDLGVRTICFHEHWSTIQNYLAPAQPEGLRSLVKACHERGMRLLVYYGYELSDIAPEWEIYGDEVLVYPRAGGYKRQPEQTAYICCYASAWQDYLAWAISRTMDEFDVDGVYLDGTANPWACGNRGHGCGYIGDDGKLHQTYPFFEVREMMKRIYTIVKTRKPHGLVNLHQSTCMTIPSVGWATSYWDGEQFGHIARTPETFPTDVLPLDAFRAEFMGHNWGVPAELLCYGRPYAYSEALAISLLHDVLVRPGDVELASKIWNAAEEFGRKSAKWLPYWENEAYVKVSDENVKCSIYSHGRKDAMIVVSNLGRYTANAEITLNLDALGLPAEIEAKDLISGQILSCKEGKLCLSLESLAFRMLWLRPARR